MSHWAELDENNIVLRVLVGDNNDPAGDEGYEWLINNLGGRWVKTSYNSIGGIHYLPNHIRDENDNLVPSGNPHFRYNYAGIGDIYDETRDAFIAPKPSLRPNGNPITLEDTFEWVLNENTCLWEWIEVK